MFQKLVINARKSFKFIYIERIAPQKSLYNDKFLTKRWDPLHLSQDKNILDLVYMHPGGVRSDTHLFYFEKSANLKHPSVHMYLYVPPNSPPILKGFGCTLNLSALTKR